MRISQAVLCARTLTLTPRSAVIRTRPGDSIGPEAPTTEADSPTMRRIGFFFHIDHSFHVSDCSRGGIHVTDIQWFVWGVRKLRHEDVCTSLYHVSISFEEPAHILVEYRIGRSYKGKLL